MKRGYCIERYVSARKRWEKTWWGQENAPVEDEAFGEFTSRGDYTAACYRRLLEKNPIHSLPIADARKALLEATTNYPHVRYRIARVQP